MLDPWVRSVHRAAGRLQRGASDEDVQAFLVETDKLEPHDAVLVLRAANLLNKYMVEVSLRYR